MNIREQKRQGQYQTQKEIASRKPQRSTEDDKILLIIYSRNKVSTKFSHATEVEKQE